MAYQDLLPTQASTLPEPLPQVMLIDETQIVGRKASEAQRPEHVTLLMEPRRPSQAPSARATRTGEGAL
ncbi:hypothetical protein NW249_23940 [Streptomyces sp. OUCMDZ-4982]|uniref:hypothetical protein n=1 Tax=Streptomyces sp. OUCMDZ-4982 TaxID=2973090 RepID=UPI00215C3CB6|nr:hypothetical protein [Streptomyces sp. OUCMDZ-4982]MCR8945172.1 hypothetical protein [Streptomyces sp. OUCMDZ-4982]